MNFLIDAMNLVNNHRLVTFVIIVTIGLVWIYFQIPKIKAKTAPPNGVVSTREDWVDAKKSTSRYSFVLSSVGIAFAYAIWAYVPTGKNDYVFIFLNAMAAICFLTVTGMQFTNKKVSNMHLNKEGDSK